PLQHAVPGHEPVQLARDLRPERFRIRRGLLVDRFVAEDRLVPELLGRRVGAPFLEEGVDRPGAVVFLLRGGIRRGGILGAHGIASSMARKKRRAAERQGRRGASEYTEGNARESSRAGRSQRATTSFTVVRDPPVSARIK